MTTLIIKDLAMTEELDRNAMAAVRGGTKHIAAPSWLPSFDKFATNFAFDASQMLGQTQNVANNNGNNVAFASGISSTVTPTQTGVNTINFGI
ncbi:hypothetical protein EGT07_25570 [Herbaspirillum sp. HC18]|nr:hypothetical protein EGT07_25570 [Herbaspirillum sp. HC18]